MTIISLKKQFMQFFNADFLQKTAKRTGFIQRNRSVLPEQLIPSLVSALSKGNCHLSDADNYRHFLLLAILSLMILITLRALALNYFCPEMS